MAITLAKEIEGTGLMAEHWVLVAMHVQRVGSGSSFTLSGTYQVWANAAAYAAGKKGMARVQVKVDAPLSGNPTVGALQQMLDDAAVLPGAPLEGGT